MRVRRLSVREALWDRHLNDLTTEFYEKFGLIRKLIDVCMIVLYKETSSVEKRKSLMSRKPIVDFDNKQPNPQFASVMDIPPQSVLEKKNSVHIIDVRGPDAFTGELGHIPGARLFTLEVLPQEIEKLPKGETIVFVCRLGNSSSRAAAFALENGFESVFNMQGGMVLWNQLDLETEGKSS